MEQHRNIKTQEGNELLGIFELFRRNIKLFIASVVLALCVAFLLNRYSTPVYNVASSVLIKEDKNQQSSSEINDFLNSNLLGKNQNFQNELWVMKSSPVLVQTIRNLDLLVTYYVREKFKFHDAYKDVPFQVYFIKNHPQPVHVRFELTFLTEGYFQLSASSGQTTFYNFETEQVTKSLSSWSFIKNGRIGELIETDELAFTIRPDSTSRVFIRNGPEYAFEFKPIESLKNEIKSNLSFNVVDKEATVIELSLKSESLKKEPQL